MVLGEVQKKRWCRRKKVSAECALERFGAALSLGQACLKAGLVVVLASTFGETFADLFEFFIGRRGHVRGTRGDTTDVITTFVDTL
tara:strand:+ start:65 stop:322 length:258 start_codon:yes stop_codon:yes gene_type:complete